MKILLLAATNIESAKILEHFDFTALERSLYRAQQGQNQLDLLVGGIGMVNTAYQLGAYLAHHQPDIAIQFGIAGSFEQQYAPLDLVEVGEEYFAELGADSLEGFLDLEQMGFALFEQEGERYYNRLINQTTSLTNLPQVKGLTVNQVSGTEAGIASLRKRCTADIESMEGAAFFHAMLLNKISFHAWRCISNRVEPRDKTRWQLAQSVEKMQDFVIAQLSQNAEFH